MSEVRRTARPWVPPLVLFLLAPAFGELLSSSSPPNEYFTVFGFTCMSILYGGGALLCRELRVRWGKGLPTLLVLGAAYGIVEEGLMVKSFFNPGFQDLGELGHYARWGGVNVGWAVFLTVFHMVVSITVPVVLVELALPADRSRSWLSRGWLRTVSTLFVIDVLFGAVFFGSTNDSPPYVPPALPYAWAIVVVAALTYWARTLPVSFAVVRRSADGEAKRPRRIGLRVFLLGFLGTFIFFVLGFALPASGLPGIFYPLIMAAWALLVAAGFLHAWRRHGPWSASRVWAAAAGVPAIFAVACPLHEINTVRTDNPSGMIWVGVATLAFLAWVRRRVARSDRAGGSVNDDPAESTPVAATAA